MTYILNQPVEITKIRIGIFTTFQSGRFELQMVFLEYESGLECESKRYIIFWEMGHSRILNREEKKHYLLTFKAHATLFTNQCQLLCTVLLVNDRTAGFYPIIPNPIAQTANNLSHPEFHIPERRIIPNNITSDSIIAG